MEFRILGPLEARVGDSVLPLGGAKQRAVLLLRSSEVVPVDRLIDEVWGQSPPPSAAHSLEAYVSRLRQLFNGHGPSLIRRGAGYCLELGAVALDAHKFAELTDDVQRAAADGHPERASGLAAEALALWRGPALADVVLGSSARAEAERLEELRLRTLEQRFDAELALGHHQELVGELQILVGQNPYRERFVGQLMLALYRSGRHAGALDVYERTRAALDGDLGLQPSAELQQLSGQMVRQEPRLGPPVTSTRPAIRKRAADRAPRRVPGMALVGALALITIVFTAGSSAPYAAATAPAVRAALAAEPAPSRVALVLPSAPEASWDDPRVANTFNAFLSSSRSWGFETDILVADENDPTAAVLQRVARRIDTPATSTSYSSWATALRRVLSNRSSES